MADTVTNQMLLDELQRLQSCVNELKDKVENCSNRAIALEVWRNGHVKNVHGNLREQTKAALRTQERQGERLWKVALQVTEVATLLAATTKLAGVW